MNKKVFLASMLAGVVSGPAIGQDAPFGGPEDVEYSKVLWQALDDFNFAGSNATTTVPYDGQHPHGAVLETLGGTIKVGDNVGSVIVKRNYGGEGVSKAAVANDRAKYLKAVTVMFKRDGYDPDNADWFWVKYLPDGSLDKNPAGMQLAGRVAKGMDKGCIACHQAAPGGDYVFNDDAPR